MYEGTIEIKRPGNILRCTRGTQHLKNTTPMHWEGVEAIYTTVWDRPRYLRGIVKCGQEMVGLVVKNGDGSQKKN